MKRPPYSRQCADVLKEHQGKTGEPNIDGVADVVNTRDERMLDDEPSLPPAERFRTPESYIHWDRGLAIVALMIGVVLVFLVLIVALPIGEQEDTRQVAGTAGQEVAVSPAPQGAARAASPTPAPTPGSGGPRLAATARQFPFVRRGPGVNFAVITNLRQGDRVDVVGRSPDRGWFQIALQGEPSRGWVSQEFLAVEGDVNTLPEARE